MVVRRFEEPVSELTIDKNCSHEDSADAGSTAASIDSLQEWLLQKLATVLRCHPDEIDAQVPFPELGLDSLSAFNLTGELAHRLKRDLPATLLWEYSTVDQLLHYLLPSAAKSK